MLEPSLLVPGVASRIAHHWLEAREPDRALGPLVLAVEAYIDGGEPAEAEAGLTRLRATLTAPDAPESDERWGDAMLLASRIAEFRANLQRATAEAQRAEAASREHGWGRVRARTFLQLGVLTSKHGLLAQAEAWLSQAIELAEAVEEAS